MEFSMLWETQTGTGDGATSYTQDQANDRDRYFDVQDPTTQGVAYKGGGLDSLEVTGTSMPLDVASGAAVCWLRYWNDAATTVDVAAPVVDTGGRVVLNTDWAANTTRLAIALNTVGNTAPPALVQTIGTQWQISLASFVIDSAGDVWTDSGKGTAGVNDEREYMKSVREATVLNPETRHLITRVTLPADGPITGLDITGLTQKYKDIELVFRLQRDGVGAFTPLSCRVATGHGNAFKSLGSQIDSSGTTIDSGYSTTFVLGQFGEDTGAGVFDYIKTRIFDYSSIVVSQSFMSEYRYAGSAGSTSSGHGVYSGNYDLGVGITNFAITDLVFSGANVKSGSSIEVYGIS